jgi:hypothetical protein
MFLMWDRGYVLVRPSLLEPHAKELTLVSCAVDSLGTKILSSFQADPCRNYFF